MKAANEGFRFKSFMIELILAHLCDRGLSLADYPEALQHFFTYLAKTDLKEKVLFTDYYPASTVENFNTRVQIIDPVNASNNVSQLYTQTPMLAQFTRLHLMQVMLLTQLYPHRPSKRLCTTGKKFLVHHSRGK